MALQLTPDTEISRDDHGNILELNHVARPYRPEAAFAAEGLTPRSLAETYLRDAADLFGLQPSATSNFAAETSPAPTQAPVELRFKEEGRQGNTVTIAYDQTVRGLPIWDAGMSVSVDAGPMQVMGSHNATHRRVEVEVPPAEARYQPHRIDKATLGVLLVVGDDPSLEISATRSLVYRYDPDQRFDPQAAAHAASDEMTGFAGHSTPALPTLPLPDVPADVKAGQHYVVTEVLFKFAAKPWGRPNWRAFIHPQNGAVLYLRALTACAHGQVFVRNPVSGAAVLGAGSPLSQLDGLRSDVTLENLSPVSAGKQSLSGKYVRLVEIEEPQVGLPQEADPFDFDYHANTRNFAALNAYHHCDGFFRTLEQLGIDVASYFNNTDFPVPVDPHAKDDVVNASAPGNVQGNGLGMLVFGLALDGSTFGISADARVVLHEFGHAVLWDHVNSPNFGWAHSPGDSFAAILHDPGPGPSYRFETFPFMKESAGLSRRHDRKTTDGWAWGGSRDDRQYGSEQILSTTLFRVYCAAGGDSADPEVRNFAGRYVTHLILKGVGLLSFTSTDPRTYVSALAQADASTTLFEGHPGGAFAKIFRWSFEQQGLFQPPGAPQPVTKPGAAPPVDVYIDDGRGGHYMPYSEDFEGDAQIWNRRAADAGAENQAPATGVKNFAYVRVRNRGTSPATELMVRGYKAGTADAAAWPTDWTPLATASIAVPAALAPGGEVVVGPFEWTPQFTPEELLFEASAAGDRSILEGITAGPILNARAVRLDNNLGQRKF